MVVQVAWSLETWIWKAAAYPDSQFRPTWLMVAAAPRSSWTHCGSLHALDQRVLVSPSSTALAGVPLFSSDDAVAGRSCEIRASAAWPDRAGSTAGSRASRGSASTATTSAGRGFIGPPPGWD